LLISAQSGPTLGSNFDPPKIVKDTYREAFRAFNIGSLLIANDQGVTFIGQMRTVRVS